MDSSVQNELELAGDGIMGKLAWACKATSYHKIISES